MVKTLIELAVERIEKDIQKDEFNSSETLEEAHHHTIRTVLSKLGASHHSKFSPKHVEQLEGILKEVK